MKPLEIDSLHYRYKDNWTLRGTETLKGISLNLTEGEIFGFLGHNGAGKTTTIKCILDLIRPSSGTVSIFGAPSSRTNARACVGYLPEQPYFYDHLTVKETLTLYGSLYGLSRNDVSTRIISLTERLGITEKLNSRMRTLSKGLVQRVGLAQAVMHSPRLLILDEPFSGLDPIGRKEFREFIRELNGAGATIFICTHVLSDAETLCSRASIMAKGEIRGIVSLNAERIQHGATYEVTTEHITDLSGAPSVGTQSSGSTRRFQTREEAESFLRWCLDKKIRVDSFECVHAGLEELFMQLVSGEKESRL